MPIRKFLVRAANWIGDAVMSVPALQQLRAHHPQAHISILARPWVAGLYSRESFCDEVIPYEAPAGWRGPVAKWHVVRTLRSRKFDCAILFQNAFEAAALARLSNIPQRVGYDRDARGWLLSHPIPVPRKGETPIHQRFYYLELLKRARLIPDYPVESAILLEGAAQAAADGRRHLQVAGTSSPVIGICPGAAHGGAKRWLPERFAEAAIVLAQTRKASIAVFGSEAELPICALIHTQVTQAGVPALNLAGATPLARFIEMAAACDLLVTNDSGPMHIASALGVPCVSIFGATDHLATGPTGAHSRIVRQPVDCSPCLLRECPIDHRCMTGVSASDVIEESLLLLDAQHPERWRSGKLT